MPSKSKVQPSAKVLAVWPQVKSSASAFRERPKSERIEHCLPDRNRVWIA